MKRNLYFYSVLILIAFAAVWLILNSFISESGTDVVTTISQTSSDGFTALKHFAEKLSKAPGILIMQLAVIMLVARVMAYLFQTMGQPMVIGEIVAGLILGPSVLGALFPGVSSFLFPQDSLKTLEQFSQLGLIFFMFIIGMELDIGAFRKSANKAFLISAAGIIVGFTLGVLLAFYLYWKFDFGNVRFAYLALFMGTTMCITAFPVLARIVQERKLTKSNVGVMVITVAAIADVVAWCILAIVIAVVNAGDINHALLTIGLSVVYILIMFYVVKPVIYRVGLVYSSREAMAKPIVAIIFLLILLSSLITEAIGIHALFGAFMAGVIMPEQLNFKRVFTEKIEDVSLIILLPLFFVSTGLKTEIGLINSGSLWLVCAFIIIISMTGKLGGTLIASRFVGLNWHDSLSLGVLMNTKGLMELIVLNIGYELGILGGEIFTMLVIASLVITSLTGPGLNLIERFHPKIETKIITQAAFKVLLSFANPSMGGSLLNLTRHLVSRFAKDTHITALHISPRSDLSPDNALIFEKESFAPIRNMNKKYGLALSTLYLNTNDVYGEIMRTSRTERPDFLIVGSARTIFSKDILGGILKRIIQEAPCDVLIFNERNFKNIKSILLIYSGNGDEYLFDYAQMLNHDSEKKFFTYDRLHENIANSQLLPDLNIPYEPISGSVMTEPGFLNEIDLVIVSEETWRVLEDRKNLPVNLFPSLLIIHRSAHENKMLTAVKTNRSAL